MNSSMTKSKRVTFAKALTSVPVLCLTLVSSCGMTGASDPCTGFKPLILETSSIDGLTDQDAEEVLAHNLYWKSRCKPSV